MRCADPFDPWFEGVVLLAILGLLIILMLYR